MWLLMTALKCLAIGSAVSVGFFLVLCLFAVIRGGMMIDRARKVGR